MNTDIQIGSKIKVVNRESPYYRWRGLVTGEELVAPRTEGQPKPDIKSFDCTLHNDVQHGVKVNLGINEVECIQKKFIDIEHIREEDVDLGNGVVRKSNIGAFEPGDLIQVSEKIDGANASIAWNEDEGHLEIFSRTNLLDGADGLRGFKAYIQTKFSENEFKTFPSLVIFGEWCVSHRCKYEKSWYNVWRVYDIWDKAKKNYLPQADVKKFCTAHGIEYIHVLYEGEFKSWDHCRSFMNLKSYGGIEQEGIVVKNQTKLDNDIRQPKYLKIVNDAFKESIGSKKEKKEIDPEVKKEMDDAKALMSNVVTEARVHKMILKLVDEGVLPQELEPKCMGTVMKNVPTLVWNDLLKEEPETVKAAGAYAGKFCSGLVSEIAKKLIIGK